MTEFLSKYYAASELIESDKELIQSTKEQKEQIEKDKQREYEIQRYFYINKNYKDITEDDYNNFYSDKFMDYEKPLKGLHIVVDTGNGAGGCLLRQAAAGSGGGGRVLGGAACPAQPLRRPCGAACDPLF